ncbi:MAG: sensor histidine kinase [Armatimonadota bacterium]
MKEATLSIPEATPKLRRIAQLCGLAAMLIGIFGLLGWIFVLPVLNSIIPGYKPIAISASIVFFLLGFVEFFAARRLLQRAMAIVLLGMALVLTLFGLLETITLVTQRDVSLEDLILRRSPQLFANPNTQIAPVAGILVLLIGLAQSLYLYQRITGRFTPAGANTVGLLGSIAVGGSAVFLLGYIFGTPLFYGSNYLPISALATIAALLLSIGLIALTGYDALPLCWFAGTSTRAKLLRAFLPPTALLLLLLSTAQFFLTRFAPINPAITIAMLIMLFELAIGVVTLQVARVMGNLIDKAERERREAEAEREQLLQQVLEERNRLRTVLDTLPVGVLINDARNRIVDTNSNVEPIFSGSVPLTQSIQEYRRGKAWWVATGEPVGEDEWPSVQALRQGKAVPGQEIEILRADGTHAIIFDAAAPLRDAAGQIAGAVVVVQDITELKRTEADLRNLTETLEQRVRERTAALEASNKELEAFSYSVSHDLRAPLRAIDGFSRILYEDYTNQIDEQGRDYLTRVRNAAQRMGRLIDDMLNLSRIGRAEMHQETVELSALAIATLDELRQREPERRVETDIMPGMLVTGDAALLRIALDNLLSNAWKFTSTREVAQITVGMNSMDGERVYYVRDNGVGFEMDYVDKLFTPFQRLHTVEEFPGTGIGLAIVQRIIARHGGRVWAEGALGKGATFNFTLGTVTE